ncbi:MAG: ArnT family glycosyltransferase [Xenococcus sp. (in: cyanobacteria)]
MRNLRSKSDILWLWGFFLAAIFLYTYNLGEVPLRDWDEAIVATIAREIWRSNPHDYTWLFPQNLDGSPYWNKPPLIHSLIALSYGCFGISEWSTRLPTAMLSALAVPLLFCIGREVFSSRLEAIYSTIVYLTLIPVVRHGRLAMLDGAIICFFALVIWCLLKEGSRYYLLGVGLGLGLICLTKGIALGVLLGAIAFIFDYLNHQTNHNLNFSCFILILLGLIPAIAWYIIQIIHYGQDFIGINLGIQTFSRVLTTVENHSHSPGYYLGEMAKYSLPWLIFLPGGIKLGFLHRQEAWAKLALVWFGIYFIAISVMATKLPWYIMPIYPAFALLVGANLARIHRKFSIGLISKILLIIVNLLAWGGTIYYGWFDFDRDLLLILAVLAILFTIANVLVKLGNFYFISIIAIALYFALFLLFNSPHWNWELGESYAVKPVAEMIRQITPAKQIIYTSYPYFRPSLDFYSDRIIIPISNQQLREKIATVNQSIYLLLPIDNLSSTSLNNSEVLAATKEWQLVKKNIK